MQRVSFMTRQRRCILHYVNVRINKSSLCWETILRVKKKKEYFSAFSIKITSLIYILPIIALTAHSFCFSTSPSRSSVFVVLTRKCLFKGIHCSSISHSRSLSSGGRYYLDVSAWITVVIHKYYANESASCLRE